MSIPLVERMYCDLVLALHGRVRRRNVDANPIHGLTMKIKVKFRSQWGVLRQELASAEARRRFAVSAARTALFATLVVVGFEVVALYAALAIIDQEFLAMSLDVPASQLADAIGSILSEQLAFAGECGLAIGILSEVARILNRHARGTMADA